MILRVYLYEQMIWSGWPFVGLTDIDTIIDTANQQFGTDNWTSFEIVKEAAE
jgi:hypothetical protein